MQSKFSGSIIFLTGLLLCIQAHCGTEIKKAPGTIKLSKKIKKYIDVENIKSVRARHLDSSKTYCRIKRDKGAFQYFEIKFHSDYYIRLKSFSLENIPFKKLAVLEFFNTPELTGKKYLSFIFFEKNYVYVPYVTEMYHKSDSVPVKILAEHVSPFRISIDGLKNVDVTIGIEEIGRVPFETSVLKATPFFLEFSKSDFYPMSVIIENSPYRYFKTKIEMTPEISPWKSLKSRNFVEGYQIKNGVSVKKLNRDLQKIDQAYKFAKMISLKKDSLFNAAYPELLTKSGKEQQKNYIVRKKKYSKIKLAHAVKLQKESAEAVQKTGELAVKIKELIKSKESP